MAVTCIVYNTFKKKLLSLDNSIDFDDGATVLRAALLGSTYNPSPDTHAFFSDVATWEIPATGNYVAGGELVPDVTVGMDTSGDFAYVDASVVTWTNVTLTARYAVVYKDTGSAATSPLIGFVDFGADQLPSGVNFSIQWNPAAGGGMFSVV